METVRPTNQDDILVRGSSVERPHWRTIVTTALLTCLLGMAVLPAQAIAAEKDAEPTTVETSAPATVDATTTDASATDAATSPTTEAGTDEKAANPATDEANDAPDTSASTTSTQAPSAQAEATVKAQSAATPTAESVTTIEATTQAHADGWAKDGSRIVYYRNGQLVKAEWVVTSSTCGLGGDGGLQRYWLDKDGTLATSKLLSPSDGRSCYWAYATEHGYVVRDRYVAADGTVYLADNDGLLAGGDEGGWVVSSAYGQGLQRYWVDADTHGCVPGRSDDGWDHYTTDAGSVLRGLFTASDGSTYLADNDGLLAAASWLVTDGLGQGLQRYWVSDGTVATGRLIDPAEGSGWWAYATPAGYVVRGRYVAADGTVYLADNDGVLAGGDEGGWVVSSAYGQGLQRYWVNPTSHGCVPGRADDGWDHYTTDAGYVLRGGATTPAGMVWADNDGRLLQGGWLVTDGLGQGLQRYWVSDGTVATGRLIDPAEGSGWWAYATPAGSVVRGTWDSGAGRVYIADNDGRLLLPTNGKEDWFVKDLGWGLQRYRTDGEGTAITSSFDVDGRHYYGIGGVGYVMRNNASTVLGYWAVADNDGVMTPIGHVEIDCPYVNQIAEGVPMGCEGASLFMALRAKGYLDGWSYRDFMMTMPYSSDGNPYNGFVGSPWYVTGQFDGIMAPAVASWGSRYGNVTNISGCTESDLVYQLSQGHPMAVWVSVDFCETWPTDYWFGSSQYRGHVMTLVGFDSDSSEFLVSDPNDRGKYWVSWSTFASSWDVLRQAVAVS